ncbi:hypothetical protein D3C84_1088430 [compost metagenome]
MARAFPWVVGDVHITFENALDTQITNEVADRFGHRVYVARRAGNRLGDHFTRAVEHAG